MDIGRKLKEARENRGITLEDVERETKIRRKYLHALEEEQFQILPGSVYAKAFLKTYASFLRLDASEIVEVYNKNFIKEAVSESPGKITKTETRTSSVPKKRNNRFLLSAIAAIAIIAGLFILGVYITNSLNQEPVSPNSSPPPPGGLQPVEETPAVNIELTVNDSDCWMLVTVDGSVAFEGTLLPGQSKGFEGKENITVKLGNAGAVTAKLNGQDIGALGSPGEVKSHEFRVN
ncbi:MAG: DUF4115 domain-containing protein [Desulfotomaculaceae bacterium]|nr:DUF4115 domain-containing protein [Desulfotomaculaceae bacterium]